MLSFMGPAWRRNDMPGQRARIFLASIAALLFANGPIRAQHVIVVPPSGHPVPPPSSQQRPVTPHISRPSPPAATERPAEPEVQKPTEELSAHEAACMADATALIPPGVQVLDAAVVFTHSHQGFAFYHVTIDVESAGRSFAYRYQCRVANSGEVKIVRREVLN
jgi:hypothetical protein